MNSIKKWILTSVLACTALFLCGVGQVKAQAMPALSYSFTAYDAQTWGAVTPTTRAIAYFPNLLPA